MGNKFSSEMTIYRFDLSIYNRKCQTNYDSNSNECDNYVDHLYTYCYLCINS